MQESVASAAFCRRRDEQEENRNAPLPTGPAADASGRIGRDIGRSGLMGRKSPAAFRTLAIEQNWLNADLLPDDATVFTPVAIACSRVKSHDV
jgi:hypothetical protein